MDEPTAGMAPRERSDLIALVKRLVVERRFRFCSPSTPWTWCSPTPTHHRSSARVLIADGNAETIRDNAQVQQVLSRNRPHLQAP
jgi:branched-chain amino acid transport system ATP-binding protein